MCNVDTRYRLSIIYLVELLRNVPNVLVAEANNCIILALRGYQSRRKKDNSKPLQHVKYSKNKQFGFEGFDSIIFKITTDLDCAETTLNNQSEGLP